MLAIETIITGHPFFQGMQARHIQQIAQCGIQAYLAANAIIFREDEEARQFFLIGRGLVALEVDVPGRGSITLQTIGEGEVLGWSWLFPPYKWHFAARTLEPTAAIVFDAVCLRTLCESDHELGYEMLRRCGRIMMQRLQATRLQLLDLYHAPRHKS